MDTDYESLFILKPDFAEEEIDKEVKAVRDIIEAEGGAIIEEDRWGKRRLAYLIKKNRYGYYVLLRYTLNSGSAEKVERHFRLNENVLKAMTVLFDGAAGRGLVTAEEGEGKGESSDKDSDNG